MKGGTVIFSRNGGSGGRHAAEEPRRSGDRSRSSSTESRPARDRSGSAAREPDDDLRASRHSTDGRASDQSEPGAPEESEPDFGPYDISEAPDGDFLDLGSLKIPTIEGVEVRVQANNEGVVQQVVLGAGDSVLQLAVFAAPRNEGIWDDVRANIRSSLSGENVAVEEVRGDYGPELRARVRADQTVTDIRFIGIDGPRWMVRAIYQGAAAREPAEAGPLAQCLRALVVDRGKEAMPAEEALPLRLPREMADAAKAQMAAQADAEMPADAQGQTAQAGQAAANIINGHLAANDSPNPDDSPGSNDSPSGHGLPSGPALHPSGGYPPSSDSTGGHPTAGNDQRGRPSPRPRRPE